MNEIRTMSTLELLSLLDKSIQEKQNQSIINMLAFEATCRTYVPFSKMKFDEMLANYGYQVIEKEHHKAMEKKRGNNV